MAEIVSGYVEPAELLGRVFKRRYRLDRLVASGGMSDVFRARHLDLERDVAIKIVLEPRSKQHTYSPKTVKRFLREALLTSRLAHPNTTRMVEFGESDEGLLFMVFEYLLGRTLATALDEHGSYSPRRVAELGQRICGSLAEAHGLGIVHRDLKPANVFLCRFGAEEHVKVMDFGIALLREDPTRLRITDDGMTLGTPVYMSPEQCRASEVTPASDLYALGVLLFEALTGETPFYDENPLVVFNLHTRAAPPTLVLPGEADELVAAWNRLLCELLAKQPQDRPGSAETVALRLAQLVDLSRDFEERAESGARRRPFVALFERQQRSTGPSEDRSSHPNTQRGMGFRQRDGGPGHEETMPSTASAEPVVPAASGGRRRGRITPPSS